MAWMCRLVGGQPGSVILDPFMGSGTTGAAAIPSGFDFVGVDLEEAHVAIARQRIAYWAEVGLAGVVYQTEAAHTAHETAHDE
jgi:site-specific DNA-methyltransferase (adenine-specific)